MPNKVVYNIVRGDTQIDILKGEDKIYSVPLNGRTINLKELYEKMQVNIQDEYFYAHGLSKIETPKNDSERVFNNVFDFLSALLVKLNGKLKELREKQDESIFQ